MKVPRAFLYHIAQETESEIFYKIIYIEDSPQKNVQNLYSS